jgi:hypothetical protein
MVFLLQILMDLNAGDCYHRKTLTRKPVNEITDGAKAKSRPARAGPAFGWGGPNQLGNGLPLCNWRVQEHRVINSFGLKADAFIEPAGRRVLLVNEHTH